MRATWVLWRATHDATWAPAYRPWAVGLMHAALARLDRMGAIPWRGGA